MDRSRKHSGPPSRGKSEDMGQSLQSLRHATRSAVALEEEVSAERKRYEEMPLEEKRRLYACGEKFLGLEQIPTWPKYYLDNELQKPRKKQDKKRDPGASKKGELKQEKTEKRDYKVDEELNEKISLLRGDITALEIDAIVNAANSSLGGGGGVDGAIHSAAGHRDLQRECRLLKGCSTGEAKVTSAYKLPAKCIIHTVGPQGIKPDLLKSAYWNSLELLKKENLRSVAFPCISTGIYGYPVEDASHVALATIRDWLEKNKDKVDRIILCVFMPKDVQVYEELLPFYFPLTQSAEAGDRKSDSTGSLKKTQKKKKAVASAAEAKDAAPSSENDASMSESEDKTSADEGKASENKKKVPENDKAPKNKNKASENEKKAAENEVKMSAENEEKMSAENEVKMSTENEEKMSAENEVKMSENEEKMSANENKVSKNEEKTPENEGKSAETENKAAENANKAAENEEKSSENENKAAENEVNMESSSTPMESEGAAGVERDEKPTEKTDVKDGKPQSPDKTRKAKAAAAPEKENKPGKEKPGKKDK